MTTRAIHFALAHCVRVWLHGLSALLLVAVEADVGLRCRGEYGIALGMHAMAAGTCNGIVIMRAAMPGKAGIVEVTVHAVRVLVRDRACRV
jgi:hypothetical protein